jgi:hypothetical protein
MVESLSRGVAPESIRKAIADLKAAGVTITDSLPAAALQPKR